MIGKVETAQTGGEVEGGVASAASSVVGDALGHRPSPDRKRLAVLVVAFHFPPIAAAGTHRTLNFVQQLAKRGHRLGVVTTGSTSGFRNESALLERVPAEVCVARASHVDPFLLLHRLRGGAKAKAGEESGAVAPASAPSMPRGVVATVLDYISRLADVPDRYASWIVPAFVQGVLLARRIDAQVVYSTAPPASAHLAGMLIADVLGLPFVADFRDPWALNPFRSVPYSSLREIDDWLESLVIERARRVILNTPLAERDYVARYRDPRKFLSIQNGIAPDLFALPRGEPSPGDRVRLLHVGSIYGRRSPLPLVRAMKRLAHERPEIAKRLAIEQIGPVEDGGALERELRACGVAERFTIHPSVSHREAFLETTRSHALLLLGVSGSSPEVQVPAKLFEYLAADRPILALAKENGAIVATLERAGADYLAADPDDEQAIYAALIALLTRIESQRAARTATQRVKGESFRYEDLALRLEDVLQSVVTGGRDA